MATPHLRKTDLGTGSGAARYPLICDADHLLIVHRNGTTTWNDKEQRFFSIALGKWTWTGRALTGNYPDWRKVVPIVVALNRGPPFMFERARVLASR